MKPEARFRAIRTILDEHRTISAVLSGLRDLARTARDPTVRPEFAVFHAMIYYIDAFPERLHHPKEEEFLFTPLVRRAPVAKTLVDALSGEHDKGARLIRALQRALQTFEINWPEGHAGFAAAIKSYADFHWDHMRKEERELLPLAESHFLPEDWEALDKAFAENHDPLAGAHEDDFDKLFQRIVRIAPAPVGMGTPWKRTSGG